MKTYDDLAYAVWCLHRTVLIAERQRLPETVSTKPMPTDTYACYLDDLIANTNEIIKKISIRIKEEG